MLPIDVWKAHWAPVITETLLARGCTKHRAKKAALAKPYTRSLEVGAKHNLAWTKCVLGAIVGTKQLRAAMADHKARHPELYGSDCQEGPMFLGQERCCLYDRVCTELDVSSAWPSCVLALEPEEGEDDCEHRPLHLIQDVMRGFIQLRDRAARSGDRVLAKGFKLAANTLLGCMKHVFPRIQNRYVALLKREMGLALGVIEADPGLQCIAMVSDSVIYTSAPGEPQLTDERMRGVADAVNRVCTCCTFEPDNTYANFVYAKKNVQFGCLASSGGTDPCRPDVFQRGIVGRLKTPEAVAHLTDLMRHATMPSAAALPSPDAANQALQALQGEDGDRERADFLRKRRELTQIMRELGVEAGGLLAAVPPTATKKRKRKRGAEEEDKAEEPDAAVCTIIMSGVRQLAKRWGVRLGCGMAG